VVHQSSPLGSNCHRQGDVCGIAVVHVVQDSWFAYLKSATRKSAATETLRV
jgi:hypothetical protein